jgi:hypothetical protein
MVCRKVKVSLRGGADDEAIPAEDKDCFAELILSVTKWSRRARNDSIAFAANLFTSSR